MKKNLNYKKMISDILSMGAVIGIIFFMICSIFIGFLFEDKFKTLYIPDFIITFTIGIVISFFIHIKKLKHLYFIDSEKLNTDDPETIELINKLENKKR